MPKGIISSLVRRCVPSLVGLALALSVIASPSLALDPYHGIYFGTFSGCGITGGRFTVFVEQQGPGGSPAIELQYGSR